MSQLNATFQDKLPITNYMTGGTGYTALLREDQIKGFPLFVEVSVCFFCSSCCLVSCGGGSVSIHNDGLLFGQLLFGQLWWLFC